VPSRLVNSYLHDQKSKDFSLDCLTQNMKTLRSFEMSVPVSKSTWRNPRLGTFSTCFLSLYNVPFNNFSLRSLFWLDMGAEGCTGVHVKCSPLLSNCNPKCSTSTTNFDQTRQNQISRKSVQPYSGCHLRTDRQTDVAKKAGTILQIFVEKAPKWSALHKSATFHQRMLHLEHGFVRC
jgi:hypothetical protein